MRYLTPLRYFWLTLVLLNRQNEEYQKSLKTFITSRNNAGVYMDTTTMINSEDPVPGQVPGKSKSVYASLRQNPDMYEDDSEDEIWIFIVPICRIFNTSM